MINQSFLLAPDQACLDSQPSGRVTGLLPETISPWKKIFVCARFGLRITTAETNFLPFFSVINFLLTYPTMGLLISSSCILISPALHESSLSQQGPCRLKGEESVYSSPGQPPHHQHPRLLQPTYRHREMRSKRSRLIFLTRTSAGGPLSLGLCPGPGFYPASGRILFPMFRVNTLVPSTVGADCCDGRVVRDSEKPRFPVWNRSEWLLGGKCAIRGYNRYVDSNQG